MFDTRAFGAYIARKRKAADLTQSDLAELLNVTRQAVSKYEVGDSFPDISILIELSRLFRVTLDELINSGNPTQGESLLIKGVPGDTSPVQLNDLVNMAPFMKPSILGEFTRRLQLQGIDITRIASLVQYLNDENTLCLLRSSDFSHLDEELIIKLIPFLDTDAKEMILKKIIDGETDWHLLRVILPYIENMTSVIESAVVDGALGKEVLEMMEEYFIAKNAVQGEI